MVYVPGVKAGVGLLWIALLAAAGCGYQVVRHRDPSGELQRVAIETLRNDSYEAGVEFLVTDALLREFLRRGAVRVVGDPENADLIVRGRVQPLVTVSRAFSSVALALEYQVTLDLDLTLTYRDGSDIPVPAHALSDSEVYLASADVEVTRKNRAEALRRVAAVLAERVHDTVSAGLER